MNPSPPIAFRPFDSRNINKLLDWFKSHARELPWRTNQEYLKNPYAVWISEVMSQQSTMAMMLPYFERWMKRFPTLESLAHSSLDEVEPYWAGLGYYSRVRNLHRASGELLNKVQRINAYPQNFEEWLTLPGVGPYTAAAVTAICFDQKIVPVDGNVIRVFSRVWGVRDALNTKGDLLKLESMLRELERKLPLGQAGAFAQAVMDLGATICKPRAGARCELCPIAPHCRSFRDGQHLEIPLKKLRPKMKELYSFVPLYRSKNNSKALLLYQIPKGRRLAGQWSLPQWDVSKEEGLYILPQLSEVFEVFAKVRHTITCHRYQVFGVHAGVWPEKKLPKGHRFVELDELLGKKKTGAPLTVSTSTRKILNFLVDLAT